MVKNFFYILRYVATDKNIINADKFIDVFILLMVNVGCDAIPPGFSFYWKRTFVNESCDCYPLCPCNVIIGTLFVNWTAPELIVED